MSQTDIKHTLRKLEFPTCAKEALSKIESAVGNRNKQNFVAQLASEFVFLERAKDVDIRKGNTPAYIALSSLQEFQLILVLVDYFSQPGCADADRYSVFLLLFGANGTSQRSKILCKLISTAISGAVPSVLCFAGTWMAQVGCSAPACLDVAQNLVSDFITYSRKTSEQLQQLPLIAPHFTAHLMVTITELYLNEQRGVLVAPPDPLVDILTDWVSENHNLCLSIPLPLVLPASSQQMAVVTPMAGMARWVVLAPLVAPRLVFSKLHLAMLQTMLNMEEAEDVANALNAQHLMPTVTSLQAFTTNMKLQSKELIEDVLVEKGIERLAMILQVALHRKCIHGNIPQLFGALETLPPHPLLDLVMARNKVTT